MTREFTHYAGATTFGNAIAVEPRYVADIVNGARNDGLAVSL